jgi:hypothetical protein
MHNWAGCNQRRGYILIGEENSQQIEGEERLTCYGYKTNYSKQFIFHVIAVLFAGIPYVLLQWCCKYATYTKHSKCSLKEAEMLLIQVIKLMFILFIAFQFWGTTEIRSCQNRMPKMYLLLSPKFVIQSGFQNIKTSHFASCFV